MRRKIKKILEVPPQASAGCRTYDQTHANKQFFPLSDLRKNNNIISESSQTLNPNPSQPQSIQPVPAPESREDWLERLKRERRKRGWF